MFDVQARPIHVHAGPQVVSFMCCKCDNGPLLYAHVLPDDEVGPGGKRRWVGLAVPGKRLGIRGHLNDPSYHDQRATGIPVDRYGPMGRPPKISKSGAITLSCGRCGKQRPYAPIGAERLMAAARDAARHRSERIRVSAGGELSCEVEPGHW